MTDVKGMPDDLRWLAENVSEWGRPDYVRSDRVDLFIFKSQGKAKYCQRGSMSFKCEECYSFGQWQAARQQLGLDKPSWDEAQRLTESEYYDDITPGPEYDPDSVAFGKKQFCTYPDCNCPIDKTTVCGKGLPTEGEEEAFRAISDSQEEAEVLSEMAEPEWSESVPEGVRKYSPYFKDVRHIETLDVYRVIDLFGCEKHGHAISHAVKKLLLSGVRTGGKNVEKDVREAIDSLHRWLEMREEDRAK